MKKRSVTTSSCIAGMVLITYAMWSVFPPMAYLFVGSVLVAFGLFVHRLPEKRGEV